MNPGAAPARRQAGGMTSDLADAHARPITSLDDLTLLWRALMGTGGFGRRSLWVVFLESGGVPSQVVMPIDDVPVLPGPAEVDGLRHVLEELGMPPVVLLLSRPGPAREQESDRRWSEALAPLTPWPVHLATAGAHPGAPTVVRPVLPS